jgi:glycosyltransferase involved in cell wall biosynthesis
VAVFFDIQGVQSAAHGERGIARYLTELSRALERWHPDSVARYLLDPHLAVPGSIEPLAATKRVAFTERADPREASVYHVGSPFEFIPLERIWPRFAHRTGMRLAVTLYDLIPAVFPEIYLAKPEVNVWYRTRLGLVRRADRVLAISQATADDALERLGLPADRVVVVGAGVSERFHLAANRDAVFSALRERLPWLEGGYVLYTGGIEPRKNIDRLLQAYAGLPAQLRSKHQLVIVCRVQPSERALLDTQLRRLGVTGQVRFPGFVPDQDLLRLYQAAELFVFPALYEGFGLPIAEAMASGTPVIASRSSSLTELVKDEEALFDPRETASIRAALDRALTDEGLRDRLRSRRLEERHTWRGVARRTAEAYEELVSHGRRPVRTRPRIAVVSPLPPQRSGVADYTYRMLTQLRDHCDIDAFVETGPDEVEVPPGVSVDRVSRFEVKERVRAGYDSVVFCLGNSEFHAEALELLRRRRSGVVLAHDVRLSGLYSWTAAFRPELLPHGFVDSLRSMYMHRIPPEVGASGGLDYQEADRYGIYMAQEVIGLADRYLVHSDYAAQVAMLDAAPGDDRKIERIHYRFPDPSELPRARPDEQAPVIISVGLIAEVKQTAKIVEAFGHLAERHPNVTLAIIGPSVSEAETQRCAEAVERFGIGERVRITGALDDEEFRGWLERASLAVQLREHSNGETQGTIADCLAAGIPAIVTALGSARELPDDAVVKVDRDVSPRALADEMATLLDDPARRKAMVEAGLRHATELSFASAGSYFYERLVLDKESALKAAEASGRRNAARS